jgi:hypothetical protein
MGLYYCLTPSPTLWIDWGKKSEIARIVNGRRNIYDKNDSIIKESVHGTFDDRPSAVGDDYQ